MSLRPRREFLRRWPALLLLGAAGALAILLPSGLIVPTSGPQTLAEFAPVPGRGEGAGDVSEFGEASGEGLGAGEGPGGAGGGLGGPDQRRPRLKRCVGSPPRQAEDFMSPPCVAFFEGDNFGATHAGVTGDEITVLVYLDPATYNVGDQVETAPDNGTYCDVDLAPNTGGPGCYARGTNTDHRLVQITRAFSRMFNIRYQTYERRVHYWIYWGLSSVATVEAKRSYAEDNYRRVKPFAVIDESYFSGNDEAYADAIARHRVLYIPGFGASTPSGAFFRQYAPLAWSFFPDAEHWASGYASYICQKVVPYNVSHAPDGRFKDGSSMNGRPRRYGLLYSSDPTLPYLQLFADLVRSEIRKCGVQPVAEAGITDTANTRQDGSAAAATARMRDADATTLLFAGAETNTFAQTADTAKYYPEVVIAGDSTIDRNLTGRLRNQNFMRSAWLVSNQLGFYSLDEDYGYQACKEGDPSISRAACEFAATKYRDHFLLFRIIQAAGPRLTPETIDRGMHALPRIASDHRTKAACFFDPGDYTCVKDSIEEWWSATGSPPGKVTPGCWRMTRGGQRFLAGGWPPGDDVFAKPNDPCNSYTLGGPYDQ